MRHHRHGPRFRLQAHQAKDRHLRQRLDRDVAIEPEVARQISRLHRPPSQAPHQSILASEELRDLGLDIRSTAVTRRRLAGLRHGPTHRTFVRRKRIQRPGPRSPHQTQARDRQPGGAPQRFEKRDVDAPHDPTVEATAHHQKPKHRAAGTGNGKDHVGVRLDDPCRIGRRQHCEARRLVVRMDAE